MKGMRRDVEPHMLLAGEYGRWGGIWWARVPGLDDLVANLAKHAVTEHNDGSITVSPSIEVWDHEKRWHGFLELGVWRQC